MTQRTINTEDKKTINKLLDKEKLQKLESFLHPKKTKYEFLQDSEEAEVNGEINYEELIHLEKKNLGEINIENFTDEKDKILFFCKSCNAMVDVSRIPSKNNKIRFQCKTCQSSDILYGTDRGIKKYVERKNSK